MNEFSKLDPQNRIFEALQSSALFQKLKSDKELYIEIRKDNYLNVYYQAGCVAKITCTRKGLSFETYFKFLNTEKSKYIRSEEYLESKLDFIKESIEREYSQGLYRKKKKTKYLTEHYYQGYLIIHKYSKVHLDAEFAYAKDGVLRFDIACCNDEGKVSFIELKRIVDRRLYGALEVVDQMEKYKKFIEKHSDEILEHYQNVYDAKEKLGLPIPPCRPTSIDNEPILLVLNNDDKEDSTRKEWILNFKNICSDKGIKLIFTNDQGEEIIV